MDKNPKNHAGPFRLALDAADVPSTCTTRGYHTDGFCEACKKEALTELEIDKTNHVEAVVLPAVPATCIETGLTEGTKCAACGEVLVAQKVVPIDQNAHDWGDWGNSTATCKEAGIETRSCQRKGCVAIETREAPATEHTPSKAVRENEVAATCASEGSYDSVVYCDVCGKELSREKVNTDKDPTNHAHIITLESSEPGCTEPGWEGGKVCEDCDATIEEGREIPLLGHTGGTATCTEPAVCTRCGQPYGDVLEHTIVVDPAVPATCQKTGLTEGSHCSVCGEVIVAQEETPKNPNNHAHIIVVGAEDPTCKDEGYTGTKICDACDNDYSVEGETIPTVDHKYGDDGNCIWCGTPKAIAPGEG